MTKPAAAYLLLGAAAAYGAGAAYPHWGAALLGWTAAAFLAAGGVYLAGRPGGYGKQPDGRLAPWSWALFGPLLGLNRLLLLLVGGRRERAFSRVAPAVFLGRAPLAGDEPFLRAAGIRAVLDVTAEFPATAWARGEVAYRNLPVLDATPPPVEVLREGVRWLAEQAAEGPVLVHCALGYQRSATFAAAYLLAAGLADSPAAAEAALRRARPGVALSPGQRRVLGAW